MQKKTARIWKCLREVLLEMCHYNIGGGGHHGLSTKKGPFSPNFFPVMSPTRFWMTQALRLLPLPLLCMFTISQISSLGHFLKFSPMCSFFLISKRILFQASAVKWGTQLWTVANLTVTSEFPTGTRLSTLISNSPLDSGFKNNAVFSRPHQGATAEANSSRTPNCLGGWQPARTVCQEPSWNLITFPRPCF